MSLIKKVLKKYTDTGLIIRIIIGIVIGAGLGVLYPERSGSPPQASCLSAHLKRSPRF